MDENGLMSLSNVAAQNIAKALNLGDDAVPTIEQAIKDEVDALGAQFAMMIADVQAQWPGAQA